MVYDISLKSSNKCLSRYWQKNKWKICIGLLQRLAFSTFLWEYGLSSFLATVILREIGFFICPVLYVQPSSTASAIQSRVLIGCLQWSIRRERWLWPTRGLLWVPWSYYLLLGAITASCVMYAAICLLLMLLFPTAFDGKKTRGVWRVSCVMLMLTCFFMVGSRN